MRTRAVFTLVLGSLSALGWGQQLFATSYTATPGEGPSQGGTYQYADETGMQLTDGVLGVDRWLDDLGHGVAYEWVGWRFANPDITFHFSQPVIVNQVRIGFDRWEASRIFLPHTVQVENTIFGQEPTAFPDYSRRWLSYDGTWVGDSLTIHLIDLDPTHWIFVDEVEFYGSVPEPSSFLTLATLALVTAFRKRRVS